MGGSSVGWGPAWTTWRRGWVTKPRRRGPGDGPQLDGEDPPPQEDGVLLGGGGLILQTLHADGQSGGGALTLLLPTLSTATAGSLGQGSVTRGGTSADGVAGPDGASAASLRQGISVLETGSTGLRTLSLCLRLAVNVSAGHVLLGVLLAVLGAGAGGAGGTAALGVTVAGGSAGVLGASKVVTLTIQTSVGTRLTSAYRAEWGAASAVPRLTREAFR